MHKLFQTIFLPWLTTWISPIPEEESASRSVVKKAQQIYYDHTIGVLTNNSFNPRCNLSNVSVRRAWDDISLQERFEFIDAVKCVMAMPHRLSLDLAAGIRTHYDDYVYTHIARTEFSHGSALFLPFHRQFIWHFEQRMRDECGFNGSLPYWAWERHELNQSLSPVFQDEPSSFGVDGASDGSSDCVTTGAFANHTVTLGPVTWEHLDGYSYNPRCLNRRFNQTFSTVNMTYGKLASLYQTRLMSCFQPGLELSIHASSHQYVGGELSNLYSSPNEPSFWLLHAQIDRVWSVWQRLDWDVRKTALYGTLTMQNQPPSELGTIDSPMDMGMAGGVMKIGEVMDPLDKMYCYMYN